jgi:hypothetical protein
LFSFKRLSGLPAYGDLAVSFPKPGSFREGIVFEFTTSNGKTWTGNFDPGYRTWAMATGIYPQLGETALFILADGQAYKINALSKTLIEMLPRPVTWMGYYSPLDVMIIADDLEIFAHTKDGILWKSERISWDGIEYVSIKDDRLIGEAFDPRDDNWHPFSVDLLTGKAEGRSW